VDNIKIDLREIVWGGIHFYAYCSAAVASDNVSGDKQEASLYCGMQILEEYKTFNVTFL
jgi:hypothetical protein